MRPHLSHRTRAAAIFFGVIAACATVATVAAPENSAPSSDRAPMWDLSDLYSDAQAWTAAHDALKKQVEAIDRYKGTLGKSAADMLAALDAVSRLHRDTDRLAVYATLKGDEDVRIAENQERQSAASSLQSLLGVKTAWMAPELLSVGADKIKQFEAQSPELAQRFGFFLDDTLRSAPHTLSAEGEDVLAASSDVLNQPDNIFSQLSNGELPFPAVTLSGKVAIPHLDQAAYQKYRVSANRADRKLVFDSFWKSFKSFEGTLGATLTTQVLGEEFQAKERHFPNALSAALFQDNMPEAVYRMLVSEADRNLPTMHRYLRLRKKLLGIKGDLAYYDVYPSMFSIDKPPHFTITDEERIARDVTAVYGPEYAKLLNRGFSGRWLDLYPRTGKAAGAYMNGSAYDVHPYLHLNDTGDYLSLSTFTHEWGHGVHTMLAHDNQPYETSAYSTFIAETASITNEMLLNDYMVAHATTKAEKLYYLGAGLELIRGTFFRQTSLAEFQLAIHEEVEKGGALSGARMTDIYCGILRKYYGEAEGVTKIDPAYCVEWAFIPHFYYGFYVYQYATSMAGAAQYADELEHEGEPARDRYITMLKAGGSDYPYKLYLKAGLDMATPAPYEALAARMNRLMDQIDALEAQK
jgi:oligoendopeptidase F